MKRQTDLQLIGYISKYGCFFMCMVYWLSLKKGHEVEYDYLNVIWQSAIAKGFISGDTNKDGLFDGKDELLILDKDGLLRLAGIDMRYVGVFAPQAVKAQDGVYFIGEMYNGATKFTHFIGLDKNLKAEYDPIENSITARDGILKTVRVFS